MREGQTEEEEEEERREGQKEEPARRLMPRLAVLAAVTLLLGLIGGANVAPTPFCAADPHPCRFGLQLQPLWRIPMACSCSPDGEPLWPAAAAPMENPYGLQLCGRRRAQQLVSVVWLG